MKTTNQCMIGLLGLVLVGCTSTKPTQDIYQSIHRIHPGMTRQTVYTDLGQPVHNAGRDAEWDVKDGGTDSVVFIVSFDDKDRVTGVHGHVVEQ